MVEKLASFWREHALNTAASVMTTHNNMFNSEMLDSEFQHGKNIQVTRMDHIRYIPMNKYLAWIKLQNIIGRDATVGATYPK
jgi:hypothetical protein